MPIIRPSSADLCLLVLFGGRGTRMGTHIPKQYLKLGQLTVAQHTLERILTDPVCAHLAGICLVLAPDDDHFCALGLDDLTIKLASGVPLCIAQGGDSRTDSVRAGLDAIAQHNWHPRRVMIHDGARCLVHSEDILHLLRYDNAILAQPVTDALKRICPADGCLQSSVERTHLVGAQTPQIFSYKLLKDAHRTLVQRERDMTLWADDAQIMGHMYPTLKVHAVLAKHPNPKLTYASDLPVFCALINAT